MSNSPCLWSVSTPQQITRMSSKPKTEYTSRAATVFRFCLTVLSKTVYIFCKICANKGCISTRGPHVISATAYRLDYVKRCLHEMHTARPHPVYFAMCRCHISGPVNCQNSQYSSAENVMLTEQVPLQYVTVGVWCAGCDCHY